MMNFRTPTAVSLRHVKEFVYEAKRQAFASTDKKTTLPDQTSVYSYRPFDDPKFPGMIYADTYCGNTIESGQESVTIDLVLRWRNQYYGGTKKEFWELSSSAGAVKGLDSTFAATGRPFPEILSKFLKRALMNLPPEFPVRGPREFRTTELEVEGTRVCGEWSYANEWKASSLFDTDDAFASYVGRERILLNGVEVYWHAYQGGLVRDKFFPIIVESV